MTMLRTPPMSMRSVDVERLAAQEDQYPATLVTCIAMAMPVDPGTSLDGAESRKWSIGVLSCSQAGFACRGTISAELFFRRNGAGRAPVRAAFARGGT